MNGRDLCEDQGNLKHLHRAVDKAGATADFLLTAKRDRNAALRFLRKAIKRNETPEKITIGKSGTAVAAIESQNAETEVGTQVRPMPGFKSFWFAAVTLAGIELMHMIRKGLLLPTGVACPARQFYSLAG